MSFAMGGKRQVVSVIHGIIRYGVVTVGGFPGRRHSQTMSAINAAKASAPGRHFMAFAKCFLDSARFSLISGAMADILPRRAA